MTPDQELLKQYHDTVNQCVGRIMALEAAMREIINQGQMFPYSAVSYRKIQKIAHTALEKKCPTIPSTKT
jgi:hypothetical protein